MCQYVLLLLIHGLCIVLVFSNIWRRYFFLQRFSFFLISVRTLFKKSQIACSLCWKYRLYYRSPSENSWGTEESAGGSSLGALSLSRSLLGARLSTWCASIFHQLSSSSAFSSETRAEFLLPPVKYQPTASGHPSRSTNRTSYPQDNSRLTLQKALEIKYSLCYKQKNWLPTRGKALKLILVRVFFLFNKTQHWRLYKRVLVGVLFSFLSCALLF